MAFKPSSKIILIIQESLDILHFDIRNNRVISYNPDGQIEKIRDAFLAAAQSFENDRASYVTQVSESFSRDAILTLFHYGSWYQAKDVVSKQPGLFYPQNMPQFLTSASAQGPDGSACRA
jgi:hypothetical protein